MSGPDWPHRRAAHEDAAVGQIAILPEVAIAEQDDKPGPGDDVTTHAKDDNPSGGSVADQAARAMVYYAAERTLMSWLRASLGMMALGFVIDRLGLVLKALPQNHGVVSGGYSFWTGSVLIFGGAAMAIVAAIRYSGIARRYRREGVSAPGHGLSLGIVATVAAATIGIVIGTFLAVARL